MSGSIGIESARRRLTGKRAETVNKLTRTAVDLLREVGYRDLTLQMLASAAGVARATVYMYFSSKDHLVVEAYWRRLSTAEVPGMQSDDPVERTVAVMRHLALLIADEPAFAHAAMVALNSADPDIERLRFEIGGHIHKLVAAAVGGAADKQTVRLIELVHTGAMVRAGVGEKTYADVADELDSAVRRLLAG